MSEQIGSEPIEVAVKFWSGLFMIDDMRSKFEEALRDALKREAAKGPRRITLYVDYDPWDLLLEAVREAGIECGGCMFSANGIFKYRKTGTMIWPNKVEAKEGYGAPYEPIWERRAGEENREMQRE